MNVLRNREAIEVKQSQIFKHPRKEKKKTKENIKIENEWNEKSKTFSGLLFVLFVLLLMLLVAASLVACVPVAACCCRCICCCLCLLLLFVQLLLFFSAFAAAFGPPTVECLTFKNVNNIY